MKKLICILLCLCMVLACAPVAAFAQGETLTGDYIVIVNTNPDPEVKESTGVITFDSTGEGEENRTNPADPAASLTGLIPAVTGNSGTVTKTYSVGNTKTVRGQNYTLVAIGDKCCIWMENTMKSDYDAAGKTQTAAEEMIKIYEGKPYTVLNTLADGKMKYLDGSGKLSVLLENDPQATASGYYAMETDITAIHINCPAAASYMNGYFDSIGGLLVHEGQHAVFRLLTADNNSTGDTRWLDEGMAVTAMEWAWGKQSTSDWLSYISGSSQIRKGATLSYSTYRKSTAIDYSLQALYVRYLCDRYAGKYAPLMFLQQLYKVSMYNGSTLKTAEEFLNDVFARTGMKNADGTTLTYRQSLVDFYTAAVKLDRSGIYSFAGDTTVLNSIGDYPVYMGTSGTAVSLGGTAAIVVKTKNGTFTVPSSHGADIQYIAVNKTKDTYKPANGSGTADDPFIVTTAEEFLCAIDSYPSASFTLAADLDLSAYAYNPVVNFTGVIDGNGHTISGLTRALCYESSGIIRNLVIESRMNEEFTGTAALVAEYNSGTIQDVSATGSMNIRIVGAGIRYMPVWATITAINNATGTVERCSSTADITIRIDANVSHDAIVSNLVGRNSGTVRDCYTAGSLNVTRVGDTTAGFFVGGIAGIAKLGMTTPFYRCYSATAITTNGVGSSRMGAVGRFAGSFPGNVYVESCFALDGMDAVGKSSSGYSVNTATAAEMKTQSTFTNWPFGTVWKMSGSSYPVFVASEDITSVEANSAASIFVGQTLDYLSVYNIYLKINGTLTNLRVTEDMINKSTLDSTTAGVKTVACTYRGHAFNLTVNVKNPTSVSDLTVYKTGKTDYVKGATYSADGVVLSAKLNGQSYATYIYTGFTYDKHSPLTLSDSTVTYTYCGQTVSQEITVNELAINSVQVISAPDKTSYASGETTDLSGLGIKLGYNDGTYTGVLEYADAEKLGVHIAKRTTAGVWSATDASAVMTTADNGVTLYLYLGNTLPTDTNAVVIEKVATVSVTQRMSIDDQIIVLKQGKAYDWASSDPVKGSGSVTVTKVSGTIPSGLSVYTPYEVGGEYDCFNFMVTTESGLTCALGDYPLVYKITNNTSGQVLLVNITIRVATKSSVAGFSSVKFRADQNSGILTEDVEGVIDSTAGRVTMYVPYGTPLNNLSLEYTAAEGGEVYTPSGDTFFMGAFNFAATNPVKCKVVAEDGTTKNYDILVEVLPEYTAEPPVIGGITNGGVFCTSATFTVTGDNITSVKDNGVAISAPYTITTAGTHTITATNDGGTTTKTITINGTHTEKTAANCHAKAVCSLCGESYGEYNSANHNGNTEIRNAVSADCTKNGYTGDTYCLGCNTKIADGSVIGKTAHTTEVRGKVAATCKAAGYTGDTYCKNCDTLISTGNTIAKLSHTQKTAANCHTKAVCSLCGESYGEFNSANHDGNTEIRNAVAADCTKSGYTGDTFCLGCNTKIADGSVINKTAHTTEVRGKVAATCKAAGYTGDTYCKNCDTLISTGTTVAKLSHIEKTAANCHAKAVCSLCGESYGEYNSANHDGNTEIRNAVAADCTKSGYTGDTYCLGCNTKIADGSVISKTAHTTEVRGKVAATCKAAGYTGDNYCKNCDTLISTGTTVAKLSHTQKTAANCHAKAVCSLCGESYGEYNSANHDGNTEIRNAVAADCTKSGYTGDTYCLGCNTKIADGSVISKTAHTTEVRGKVAATCKAAGYTGDTYCKNCNTLISKGSATAKLNHKEGTAATCKSAAICSLCGEKFGQKNPDNHTNIRVDGAVSADIGKDGYTGDVVCNDCGALVQAGTVIPAKTCSCMCHKTGFMSVIYKIVRIFWKLFKVNPSCECGATHY